jgi:hypothetical protein
MKMHLGHTQGHAAWKYIINMSHRYAAGTLGTDIKHGHTRWTCMKYGNEAWTCSIDIRLSVWTCSIDKRNGHAA